ncbi:hypothetical protein DFH05DRAFT_1525286 [Lentinula detonsa]|uniref:Uncharacterized protein n=1 Tax=Lentinula detonsa TaxID=2804962 RepID=A0A9W8TXN8_9AGAR|nr:hypothetical protein DFH05DRAFT_1525286 [Lentinula detonsa]
MYHNAKASSSKHCFNDDGDDKRRRPRKRMEDRKKEWLAHLHQKLRMCKTIVEKEKRKEQRDEEDDEERQNELPPAEEPPMPLASRSDFPSNHWVEPIEERLDPFVEGQPGTVDVAHTIAASRLSDNSVYSRTVMLLLCTVDYKGSVVLGTL